MWVKMEGKETSLRDMLASNRSTFWLYNIDIPVPALVALGKEQDVMKWSVKWMQMADIL